MADIIGAFVGGLAKFLFDIVKDRTSEPRARRSEEARIIAERQLAEYNAGAALQRIDRESFVRRYPFGEPGRLKQHYRISSKPCVFIASLPWGSKSLNVASEVFDILSNASNICELLQPIPQVVVSDGLDQRQFGRAEAVEIAQLEFPGQPAIIVYFEALVEAVSAHAYFWRVFPTTTGDEAFSVRAARYRRRKRGQAGNGLSEVRISDNALPSFADISLPVSRQRACEIVSQTLGAFIAASIDVYWYTQGVHSDLFDTTTLLVSPAAVAQLQQQDQVGTRSNASRVREEMAELRSAGFNYQHMGVVDGENEALIVDLPSGSIVLLLPATYPDAPPVVRVLRDGGTTNFDFETGAWTPERTLTEVLGAFT